MKFSGLFWEWLTDQEMGRYRSREYQEEVGFSQPSYHNLGFLSEKPYILNCNYCKQKIDGGGILDRDVIRSLQALLSQSEFILGKPGLYDNYVCTDFNVKLW